MMAKVKRSPHALRPDQRVKQVTLNPHLVQRMPCVPSEYDGPTGVIQEAFWRNQGRILPAPVRGIPTGRR